MQLPFRKYHSLHLLEDALTFNYPVDWTIYRYFRQHKALGSKDRAEISQTIYTFIKWLDLINFLLPDADLEEKLFFMDDFSPEKYQGDPDIPVEKQVSCPKELFDSLVKSLGEEQAKKVALCCNTQAPTTIRTNNKKISRDDLMVMIQEHVNVSPCKHSPQGIELERRAALFSLPAFKKGFFEMQDEGSQLLSYLVEPKAGDLILDFCSGSGGKSLAFAPLTEGKGQIFLHDIRERALVEAKVRFKRAGVQNVQFLHSSSPSLKKLKKKCEWVFVDAPCSGTGTLRRNPDMKYRFDQKMLEELQGKQRNIFEKALSFVKPGGKIIYATCSILKEENEDQAAFFLEHLPVTKVKDSFQSLPKEGEMDGFFGIIFQKNT
jgi:16S rRNA (cytosine967-C5)-methyltransferase